MATNAKQFLDLLEYATFYLFSFSSKDLSNNDHEVRCLSGVFAPFFFEEGATMCAEIFEL